MNVDRMLVKKTSQDVEIESQDPCLKNGWKSNLFGLPAGEQGSVHVVEP